MNRIYRIVWSKVRNCYVVTSELAKRRTKSPKSGIVARTLVAGVLACVLSCGVVTDVSAETYYVGGGSATGENSVAIGQNSVAIGDENVSIGYNSLVSDFDNAIVIGANNLISNNPAEYGSSYSDIDGYEIIGSYEGGVLIGNNASAKIANNTGRLSSGDSYGTSANGTDMTVDVPEEWAKISHVIGVGDNVKIGDMDTVALGYYSKATSKSATAVGHGSYAKGEDSLALGASSNANGVFSTSVGWGSEASGKGSSAIGPVSGTKGDYDIALGFDADIASTQGKNTAVGFNTTIKNNATNAIAVGTQANVTESNGIAIGRYANAQANNGIAIGQKSLADASSSVAIGSNSVAVDDNVVSFGHGAYDPRISESLVEYNFMRDGEELGIMKTEMSISEQVSNNPQEYKRRLIHVADGIDDSDVATVGQLNAAIAGQSDQSVHFVSINTDNVFDESFNPSTLGNYNGDGASGGQFSMAIGPNASATWHSATAIGNNAKATDIAATALGFKANSAGQASLAFGMDAEAKGNSDVVIGRASKTRSTNGYNVVLGINNTISGNAKYSVAIGNSTGVSGSETVAIGNDIYAPKKNGVAIGRNTMVVAENSVALGSNSMVMSDESDVVSFGHSGDVDSPVSVFNYRMYDSNTGLQVYVDDDELEGVSSTNPPVEYKRRLIHVADGINDSDVATVGQLKANSAHFVGVNDYGNDYDTPSSSIDNYDGGGASGIDSIAIGPNALASYNSSTAVGSEAQAKNLASASIGWEAVTEGKGSVALGGMSKAKGDYDVAVGFNSKINSTAGRNVSIGMENQITGSDAKSSVAIGSKNYVSKQDAVVIGTSAYASAEGGIALGKNSMVGSNNSLALGSNSMVTSSETDVVSFGNSGQTTLVPGPNNEYYFLDQNGRMQLAETGDSGYYDYIYNENPVEYKRRLIHVADGINDSDVATVGQLRAIGDISNLGTGNTVENITNPIMVGRDSVLSNSYDGMEIAGYSGTVLIGNEASAETSNSTGRYSTGDLYEISGNVDGTVNVPSDFPKIAHAVGVGDNVKIGDMDTVAVGYQSKATSKSATAVGHGANASAEESIALGTARSSGIMSSALGWGASSSSMGSSAIGTKSNVKGDFDVALGFDSSVKSTKGYNTAIGYKSTIKDSAEDSIALGSKSVVSKNNSVAIGTHSNVQGNNSVALGQRTLVNASRSVAVGSNSVATDEDVVSFGRGAYDPLISESDINYRFARNGDELVLIEEEVYISDQMVGNPTEYKRRLVHVADGINDSDVATVGQLNAALANANAGINNVSYVGTNFADGLGNQDGNGATGQNSIAIGGDARATSNGSMAIGKTATALKAGSVALGSEAVSANGNAVAIGNKAWAISDGGVAIGANSIASSSDEVSVGYKDGMYQYTDGDVGVGLSHNTSDTDDGGLFRRITNVKNGTDRHDAVTVGQLDDTVAGYATKDMDNLSDTGAETVRQYAKDAVKVIGSSDFTVVQGGDVALGDGGGTTAREYMLSLKKDGVIEENDTGIVTGGTVYEAVNTINASLDNKANIDASNVDNPEAWGLALGTGEIAQGNTELVSGGTVFNRIDSLSRTMDNALATKANIDLDNISDDGTNAIATIAQRASKVVAGQHTDVTVGDENSTVTYAVNVKTDGAVAQGNTGIVTGGQVYESLQDQANGFGDAVNGFVSDMNTALADKANVGLDNINDAGKGVVRGLAQNAVKLVGGQNTGVTATVRNGALEYAVDVHANGQVASGNTGLMTGSAIYGETRPADGNYIANANTVGENLTVLDTALKDVSDRIDGLDGAVADPTVIRYDSASKAKLTLGGAQGTTVTNLKDGALSATSADAVTGRQLYAVSQKADANASAISGLRESVTGNTNAITALDGRVSSIETSVTEAIGTANGLRTELDALNDNVSSLGTDVSGLNTNVSNLNADMSNVKTAVSGLQDNVSALQGNYDAVREDVAGLQSDMSDISADVTDLRTDMGTVKTDVSALQADVSDVKDGLTVVTSEVDTIKGTLATVQSDTAEMKDDIGTLRTDVGTLRQDMDAKANADGSNIDISKFVERMKSEDTGFVTDEALADETRVADDGFVIRKDVSAKENMVGLDNAFAKLSDDLEAQRQHGVSVRFKDGLTANYDGGGATGDNSVAIGPEAEASGEDSVAMGHGSRATGRQSIALGTGNRVTGDHSGAFGDPNEVTGDGSYAFGNDNTVSGNNTFVLGNNISNATGNNTVVLGSNSDGSMDNVVSIGSAGNERKIVHMADGNVSANSKEAVNGGQLFSFKRALEQAENIDADKWAEKLGTGEVADGDTNLVTGGTVYDAINSLGVAPGSVTNDAANGQLRIGGNAAYDNIDTVNFAKSDGSSRVLTGIATNPADPNSAANVGYVDAVGQNIIDGVNREFTEVNDRMDKVGAGAAAMAGLVPGSFEDGGRWNFSAAVGNYRSATAGAVGMFYKPTENVTVAVKGAFGNGENMVAGGVGIALGKGDVPGVTKAQLAKTVNAQADKLKEQDMRIAELERKLEMLVSARNDR